MRRGTFLFVILLFWGVPVVGVSGDSSFRCAGIGVPHPRSGADLQAKAVGRGGLSPAGRVHAVAIFATFAREEATLPAYAPDLFRPDRPGSLSHFYTTMSFGRLTLTGETLPQVYVSGRPASGAVTAYGEEGFGAFTREILAGVDREVDFGRYDDDGPDGVPNSGDDDGVVDCVFINLLTMPVGFLKGTGATGTPSLGFMEYTTDDPAAGNPLGVRFITIRGRQGTTQRVVGFAHAVGSMAHEFGHLLGLPDLYDEQGETPEEESAGVGAWCLMGWGATGWHGDDGPNPFSAWCREQLGWVGEGVREVREPLTDVEFPDVETGGPIYRIPMISALERDVVREYVLIEHRQRRRGYYDRQIPGEGLLIWHINRAGDNTDERRKLVDLVCADGRFADAGFPMGRVLDPERGGDNLDFWSRDEAYRQTHEGNLGDATDPFDGERFTALTATTNPSSAAAGSGRAMIDLTVTRIRRRADGVILADLIPVQWAGLLGGDHRSEVVWAGTVHLVGDLVIAEGATLSIAPGTVIRVASQDVLWSEADPERVEIIVRGVLQSFGSPSNPVIFTGSDWSGIRWEVEEALPLFQPGANRLEGARSGLSVKGRPFPVEGVHLIGSNLHDLTPGTFPTLIVTLWNASSKTVHGRLHGVIEHPFVRIRDETSYAITLSPGGTGKVWLPMVVASETPEGQEVSLVVRLTADTGEDLQETLRMTVVGRDTTPPSLSVMNGLPGGESSRETHVDTPFTATLMIREPGPLEEVTAYLLDAVTDAVIDSLPIVRRTVDGDRGQTSLLQPDGTFTIRWLPPQEGWVRVVAVAIDAAGNTGRSVPITARLPAQRQADVLLYGAQAKIAPYRRLLDEAGIQYETWVLDERGGIAFHHLAPYGGPPPGVVIWLDPSETGIQTVNALLGAGGRILTTMDPLGERIERAPHLQAFFLDFVKATPTVSPIGRVQVRGVPGDPITDGLAVTVRAYDIFTMSCATQPILIDEAGATVGVRTDGGTYRVVHMGFNLIGVKEPGAMKTLVLNAVRWLQGASAEPLRSQTTGVEEDNPSRVIPERVVLEQNVPNPFNGATAIRFRLPVAGWTTLVLYDLTGQRIRRLVDRFCETGVITIRWDGRDDRGNPVASGLYVSRLMVGSVTRTRKLMVLR